MANLFAVGRCLLNPLVVRRFAPVDRRMVSAAIVPVAKRPEQRLSSPAFWSAAEKCQV